MAMHCSFLWKKGENGVPPITGGQRGGGNRSMVTKLKAALNAWTEKGKKRGHQSVLIKKEGRNIVTALGRRKKKKVKPQVVSCLYAQRKGETR